MSSSNWPHIKLQRELLICLAMHLFVLHLEHIVCFTSWTCYLFMPSPSRNQTPTNIMFLRLVVFWSPLHFEVIVCLRSLWVENVSHHYFSYLLWFLLLGMAFDKLNFCFIIVPTFCCFYYWVSNLTIFKVLGNKRMGFTRNMYDVAFNINFFSLVFVGCGSNRWSWRTRFWGC